jgi:hypothetical protein
VVEALIEELQTAELLHLDETPSRTLATQTGMTNDWLAQQGLLSIRDLWMKAQGYS